MNGRLIWPAQCECGHIYLEHFEWPTPREDGSIGFSYCGFCRQRRPKFAKFAITGCSQCGQDFGPGDCGYSHCKDHICRGPVAALCPDCGMKYGHDMDAALAAITWRLRDEPMR